MEEQYLHSLLPLTAIFLPNTYFSGEESEAKPLSLLPDKAGIRSCQEAGEA